jgi:glycosyltransferase involved in cell wall biosynthesis
LRLKRRRVVHVVSTLGTGGTEMMGLRLAQHWQHRFDQRVLALTRGTGAAERRFRTLSNCDVLVRPDAQGRLATWHWFRSMMSDFEPDAVLIHIFGVPHLLAASAARSMDVPAAASAGNPPPRTFAGRLRWAAILRASDMLHCPVMACSLAVDRELRALHVGMPRNSRPIFNAIDVVKFQSRAPGGRLEKSHPGPVVGIVARLDSIKDHATLLQAFALLQREMPAAELRIIGDGPLRQSLEQLAFRLGIAHATKFLGERSDIAELLAEMDVFAFSTTRNEGFGIALIEAMAAGVAVVATNVPACREVLADGLAGVLVAERDPAALARAIASLLRNHRRRASNAESAKLRVEQNYSIDVCAAKWERLFFGEAVDSVAKEMPCVS